MQEVTLPFGDTIKRFNQEIIEQAVATLRRLGQRNQADEIQTRADAGMTKLDALIASAQAGNPTTFTAVNNNGDPVELKVDQSFVERTEALLAAWRTPTSTEAEIKTPNIPARRQQSCYDGERKKLELADEYLALVDARRAAVVAAVGVAMVTSATCIASAGATCEALAFTSAFIEAAVAAAVVANYQAILTLELQPVLLWSLRADPNPSHLAVGQSQDIAVIGEFVNRDVDWKDRARAYALGVVNLALSRVKEVVSSETIRTLSGNLASKIIDEVGDGSFCHRGNWSEEVLLSRDFLRLWSSLEGISEAPTAEYNAYTFRVSGQQPTNGLQLIHIDIVPRIGSPGFDGFLVNLLDHERPDESPVFCAVCVSTPFWVEIEEAPLPARRPRMVLGLP